MDGNRRMLCLAFSTVVAMSVMAVPPTAQAEGEFAAEEYPATTTALHETRWTGDGRNLLCSMHTHSFLPNPDYDHSVDVEPIGGCLLEGMAEPWEMKMNGCQNTYEITETLKADRYSATMGVKCPEGKKIVIAWSNCEIQIGSQSGLKEVEFINNTSTSPKDITMISNVKKLKYNVTKDGFLCPLSGTGEKSDGEIVAESTVHGTNEEEEPQGIWIDD